MQGFTLKRVGVQDVLTLQQISIDTFRDTFADTNDAADLQQYLDTSYNVEKLTAEINNTDSSFYLLFAADIPVGYMKVNFRTAQTEKDELTAVELERIYIANNYQGVGAGKMMLDHAIQLAVGVAAPYIWLGVWEHNYKAIRFYEKNGFNVFSSHVFQLGSDMQTDLLMKKLLQGMQIQ